MSSSCVNCAYDNTSCPNPVCRVSGGGCSSFKSSVSFEIIRDDNYLARLTSKFSLPPKFVNKKFHTVPQNYVIQSFCEPKKILFNYPATIVFWKDGTKTVVKCAAGTDPDLYNAFCAALAKKISGSNSHLKKVIEEAYEKGKK